MTEPSPERVREIRNEDGDLLFRVVEEHEGTMFAALRCEGRSETRRVTEYPERWHRMSDRKLHALCQSGELVSENEGA